MTPKTERELCYYCKGGTDENVTHCPICEGSGVLEPDDDAEAPKRIWVAADLTAWCHDPMGIRETDIEYTRADLADAKDKRIKKLEAERDDAQNQANLWATKEYHTEKRAKAAEAKLEERLNAQTEWKPIETAPKDFSVVLIYDDGVPRNNEVGEGYFSPAAYGGDEMWHWNDDNSCAFPTHWMPLPAPPSQLTGRLDVAANDEAPSKPS